MDFGFSLEIWSYSYAGLHYHIAQLVGAEEKLLALDRASVL